jgi:hypothetical protein
MFGERSYPQQKPWPLSERGKRLYEKYGLSVFGWDASEWSAALGVGKGSKGGKGGKGGKPRATSGDGHSNSFLDLSDPSKLAQFEFSCKDGTKRTGSLSWQLQRKGLDKNGNVYYYLVAQGDGNSRKPVDDNKPIYYRPLDGGERIKIEKIEEFFPKPSPWIRIVGVGKKIELEDIEEELERNLKQGATESDDDTADVGIVDVRREEGNVFVKFDKVWNAKGCALVLDGTMFDGKVIDVKCILENNLPGDLKRSEARKRDAKARAKKKVEAED